MENKEKLNRESLLNGDIHALAASRPGVIQLMPDDERNQMVAELIANAPSKTEIWVFAYGSLIWNPAIEFDSKCRCTIQGYHRSFCFWTMFGRGSEEQPGLMMGLEPGGDCDGIAYRIGADALESEIDILFRREMLSYVYKPTWIKAQASDDPDNVIDVLTFVVNEENDRFCGEMDEQTLIRTIAIAEGAIGRNCDYLYQLVDHLDELGFEDPTMTLLEKKVRQYRSERSSTDQL